MLRSFATVGDDASRPLVLSMLDSPSTQDIQGRLAHLGQTVRSDGVVSALTEYSRVSQMLEMRLIAMYLNILLAGYLNLSSRPHVTSRAKYEARWRCASPLHATEAGKCHRRAGSPASTLIHFVHVWAQRCSGCLAAPRRSNSSDGAAGARPINYRAA